MLSAAQHWGELEDNNDRLGGYGLLDSRCNISYAPFKRTQTLLANNSQNCWMLHVASVQHTLLHVFACCWELLRKVWNRSNFKALQRDATLLAKSCCVLLHLAVGLLHVIYSFYPYFSAKTDSFALLFFLFINAPRWKKLFQVVTLHFWKSHDQPRP